MVCEVQWNLPIMDTLRPGILSFRVRLSSVVNYREAVRSLEVEMYTCNGEGTSSVSFIVSLYSGVHYQRFHCVLTTTLTLCLTAFSSCLFPLSTLTAAVSTCVSMLSTEREIHTHILICTSYCIRGSC